MEIRKKIIILVVLLTSIVFSGCAGVNGESETLLEASGIISADSINISPEVGGRVTEVFVSEGQTVAAGDMLFTIDDEIYLAQREQAEAAVVAAEATVEAAKAQLNSAQIQYELAVQGARLSEIESRNSSWFLASPSEIELPEWYFTKVDRINALKELVGDSAESLDNRMEYLEGVLADASKDDFIAVEDKLANAQLSFQIADQALEVTRAAQSNEELLDAAEQEYDAALAELENVQQEYNRLLSSTAAQEVLEARAEVAVSQLLYDQAQDQLAFLLSGDESLQVLAAEAGVKQAETAVSQAEANLEQANASLALLEIQADKTKVTTPMSGIVLVQNLDAGELVGAGGVVMRVGNLDEVSLLVYVPENRYGQISLNQEVVVEVDSFADKSYSGFVTNISDEAEFTPSNVQTVEGRKSTVFAIEITIGNPNHDLKPGMPADVTFLEN